VEVVAKIGLLPSNGLFLSGKIRDLSLGGCCADTPVPMECGARAEIVVHVNSSSFRAVGEVRGIHGNSEAGIQFIYLSGGGKDLLADLLAELARFRNRSASNWRAENFWRQCGESGFVLWRDLRPRRVRKRIKSLPLARSQAREGSRL
jgi:PilZ domain